MSLKDASDVLDPELRGDLAERLGEDLELPMLPGTAISWPPMRYVR